MGEVYRATDTNLKRQVALKVLPAAVASDVERLARFQREAEVLAALNHPRIAAIYGLERSGGTTALVMEFVEGEDLSQRIARGPIPVGEALPVATQIAEALGAAHEQGIIHRDLKPANIKIRPDGTVKVLDFGLAKAIEHGRRSVTDSSGAPADSPTFTTPAMTHAGMILGTTAYMSPEQARGQRVDKRSDIWAFGCVLYEMLTGRRAFDGETVTDVLSAIVKTDPDWTMLPDTTPVSIRRLLRRALEKDPLRRLADIADARFELDEAADAEAGRTGGAVGAGASKRRVPVTWLAVAGLAVVTIVSVWGWGRAWRASVVRPPGTWVAATLALDVPNLSALTDRFAVAPDGGAVALVGPGGGLSLRRPSALEATPIPGVPRDAFSPVFSPDGHWIAFSTQGALMKIPTAGGTPALITRGTDYFTNMTWGADDRIRYPTAPWDGIQTVPADGGPVQRITLGPGTRISRAEWMPGGRLLVSIASGSAVQIAVREADGTLRVLCDGWDGRLAPSGHLLYSRTEGQVWALVAVPFDASKAAISGQPVVVARDVAVYYATPAVGTTAGDLFYMAGKPRSDRRVVILDRSGGERDVVLPRGAWVAVAPSPDGKSLALSRWEGARRTLWTVALATGALTQATYADDTFAPVWAADGKRLMFTHFPIAPAAPRTSIWTVVPDGRGQLEPVPAELDAYPSAASADGRTLYYERYRTDQDQSDIVALQLGNGGKTLTPILATPASEESARPSPDGRWLAFSTNASGATETRIAALADVTAVVQVSEQGGAPIGWSSSGVELYYRDGGAISVVGVSARGPELATRRVAFRLPRDLAAPPAIMPDGQHAILIQGGSIYSDLVLMQGALAGR